MSPRQLAVLRAIDELRYEKGYSPSTREIMELAGFSSTSLVIRYMRQLVSMGLLTREPWMSRTVRLTDAGWRVLEGAKEVVR